MKRVKSNYHALHVLKTAEPKVPRAVILNCKKELVNSICEFISNVLNGNVMLSVCTTSKFRKHRATLRKLVDKRGLLSTNKTS